MICRYGLVGAAGQTASTNGLEPPLQIISVVVHNTRAVQFNNNSGKPPLICPVKTFDTSNGFSLSCGPAPVKRFPGRKDYHPCQSLAMAPTPASPVCSINNPSTFNLYQPSDGASQNRRSTSDRWTAAISSALSHLNFRLAFAVLRER